MNLAQKIREFSAPAAEPVETPSLGTVYVRPPTVGEIERIFGPRRKGEAIQNSELFATFAVDKDGESPFDGGAGERAALVAKLPHSDVKFVAEKVLELAGIRGGDSGK